MTRRREQGLSLVEAMVSVVLLASVVLGSLSLVTLVFRQNKTARIRSVATSLAGERLERLMAQPFQVAADFKVYRLPGEVAGSGPPLTLVADYGSIRGHPDFRRVVTLVYQVPSPGMLHVTSEVSWRDLHGGEKSHVVVTYLHPELEEGL